MVVLAGVLAWDLSVLALSRAAHEKRKERRRRRKLELNTTAKCSGTNTDSKPKTADAQDSRRSGAGLRWEGRALRGDGAACG
eukprot:1290351-Rhodomonas_salina.1